MNSLNRARDLVLAISIALASMAGSACSDETGIIIKVTTKDGFTAPVSKLRFFVGESIIQADGHFADRDQLADEDVAGRDLVADPFKLIVRPRSGANSRGRIAVGVLALDGPEGQEQAVGFGYLPDPIAFVSGSVTQWTVELHDKSDPDYVDTVSGCFGWTDGTSSTIIGAGKDLDCDGYEKDDEEAPDCNDRNPNQFPTNTELCDNDIDDDCDPATNEDELQDVAEICNGRDDNCDGNCDEDLDGDGDGYTVCGSLLADGGGQCLDFDPSLIDCQDDDNDIHPTATEVPDGLDNNCSGVCDDDPALDFDGDGFTAFGRFGVCSPAGDIDDCELMDESIYPGSHDFCDGVDGDCRFGEEELTTCFLLAGVPDVCVQGRRSCSTNGALGECLALAAPVSDIGLDPQVCADYEACKVNTVDPYIDPYECTLAGTGLAPDVIEACYTTSTATGLCPAGNAGGTTAIDIPFPGGIAPVGLCTSQIIGHQIQQGFHVSLSPGPPDDVTLVNECSPKLAIAPTAASTYAHIIITRTDSGGNFQVVQLDLINTVVDDCGGGPGLTCDNWPAGSNP